MNSSNGKVEISEAKYNQWDNAIKSAEDELRDAEVKVHRLRFAIQTFKENKRLGVKWPEISDKHEMSTDLS